ncbi:hypothetical protein TNCV_3296081 [Trichonephila clavipes]|uniref:Uncharacterized protein n=1 Tax=Trichonephila clavipes TaxID=2585209 RepID=A0A8X6VPP6_TRICX|nr:hypothetical protein TNCV_3296081 [Trichonephila clavipes]
MALRDGAATSRALSKKSGSFAKLQVSARTVRRRTVGLSARRPCLRLPLTLHHRSSMHQDGRIRVWGHHD